ncbi:MAG: UDP-N-acetylglucosamine 2-epimerase (non-hydrolyzing) [Gammaproteobacteria bacterium]|nr:UDP-N-acetylglucosamine 2-epimerase (non-hydrolyzing) [Gammaproteobacteria bacterium]
MGQLKVMTIVGTRPEVIKLSRVIAELEKQTDHVLVHTGQNYDFELNEVFFKDLELRAPDYFLGVNAESVAERIGLTIARVDEILGQEIPDAVLFYGDTNSCLAAISAKRRQIPVFHMEAGNRCFDERIPEEINRRIIDHISDINMPLTEHARRHLLREGIRPETIIKTGSTMSEVLAHYHSAIDRSDILKRLGIEPRRYFLVSAHREENVDDEGNFKDLLASLEEVQTEFKIPIIFSTHPRTRLRLQRLCPNPQTNGIQFLKPLGFLDYVKLQTQACCVLSDSGTITEEASLLNLPAITIRQTHERPEGMDEGILIMSGLKPKRVVQAIHVVVSQFERDDYEPGRVCDYDGGRVSKKVVRIIYSYVDYVNRTVYGRP